MKDKNLVQFTPQSLKEEVVTFLFAILALSKKVQPFLDLCQYNGSMRRLTWLQHNSTKEKRDGNQS